MYGVNGRNRSFVTLYTPLRNGTRLSLASYLSSSIPCLERRSSTRCVVLYISMMSATLDLERNRSHADSAE